ncbi:MAG: hypothetical protein NVS3B12_17180 [Acidimicrobiales bacterium]
MVVVGLVVGATVGSVTTRHGVRPVLGAANTQLPTGEVPTLGTTGDPGAVPQRPIQPTSPSTGSAPGTGAIAAGVTSGIVDIDTMNAYSGASGAGTGMILTAGGDVLTNNHVIEGSTVLTATSVTTGRRYRATVVGTDPTQDIAVIHVQGASGLVPAPFAPTASVAIGDPVVAVGNAGGVGGPPSVVAGTVRATGQTITASDLGGANPETLNGLIQTDAPIRPGDSGGALVNSAAKVIGMNTAASVSRRPSSTDGEGFSIPIAQALAIAHQIEAGQASATVHLGVPGFLGVSVRPAGSSGSAAGAQIGSVEPGLAADLAGVRAGDTVTAIGGERVDSATALTKLIRSHRPGARVSLVWSDQSGATHTATLTLTAGPAD